MIARLRQGYECWVQSVRRVTTSGEIIPEIDGLRFLAIAGVFVHHIVRFLTGTTEVPLAVPLAMDGPGRIADHGVYGVQLFFIISGFILGLPFAAHYLKGGARISLGKYYLRRMTRLEPPYLATMLLCFGLSVWAWHESAAELLPHLLASMIYSHNWIYGSFSSINPVAWSLEIEVQFYLAAPFLARMFVIRRRALRRTLMVALVAGIVVLQTMFVADGSRLYYSLAGTIHFFLAGFILADIYVTDWHGAPKRSLGYDVAILGCLVTAAVLGVTRALITSEISRYVTHALALGVLVFPTIAAFRSRYFRSLMRESLLVSIGGMCYTIYLLHYPLMHVIGQFTRGLVVTSSLTVNLFVHTLVAGLPIVAFSTCFYLAIEKPCMRKDWPARLYNYLACWFDSSTTSSVVEKPCSVEEPIP